MSNRDPEAQRFLKQGEKGKVISPPEYAWAKSSMSQFFIMVAVALTILLLVGSSNQPEPVISITVERTSNSASAYTTVPADQPPAVTADKPAAAATADKPTEATPVAKEAAPAAKEEPPKEEPNKEEPKQEPKKEEPAPAAPAAPVEEKKTSLFSKLTGGGEKAAPAAPTAPGSSTWDGPFVEPDKNPPGATEPYLPFDNPDGLHLSPLPKFNKEQLMDKRDLYARLHVPVDYQGENIATVAGFRKLFKQGRDKHWEQLQHGYGEYAERMFKRYGSNRTKGESILTSVYRAGPGSDAKNRKDHPPGSDMGVQHFQQKLKLKILQAQIKFLEAKNPTTTLSRFVHLHGGHSAAAGHGNLYDESYTAFMEKALRPVLRRVGINYVGRNYAAGGTSSALQVSMCSNAYFGHEADMMSWDYGMTDGKSMGNMMLYTKRAALRSQLPPLSDDILDIPSRPAMMAFHTSRFAWAAFGLMEMYNMTVVHLSGGAEWGAMNFIPNSERIANSTIIEALPQFVQNFRCNKGFESGSKICGDNKYNMTICQQRSHRAGWHPGFRTMALEGNLMALGVLDHMERALDQLAALEPENESKEDAKARLTALFWELNNEEQARYDAFMKRDIHDRKKWDNAWFNSEMHGDVPSDLKGIITLDEVARTNNMCHMAKLPSDIRYRGLLTENFDKSTINILLDQTYDQGFYISEIIPREKEMFAQMNATNPAIPTAYPAPRQNELILTTGFRIGKCPGHPDYVDNRDAFYISNLHGWRGLTLPNDAEEQFYKEEYDAKNSKGWIMMCMGACSWGKCTPDDARPHNSRVDRPVAGNLEATVNGVPVSEFFNVGDCIVLRHKAEEGDANKGFKWTPNEKGKFDFQFRITGGTGFGMTKIASIILW